MSALCMEATLYPHDVDIKTLSMLLWSHRFDLTLNPCWDTHSVRHSYAVSVASISPKCHLFPISQQPALKPGVIWIKRPCTRQICCRIQDVFWKGQKNEFNRQDQKIQSTGQHGQQKDGHINQHYCWTNKAHEMLTAGSRPDHCVGIYMWADITEVKHVLMLSYISAAVSKSPISATRIFMIIQLASVVLHQTLRSQAWATPSPELAQQRLTGAMKYPLAPAVYNTTPPSKYCPGVQ